MDAWLAYASPIAAGLVAWAGYPWLALAIGGAGVVMLIRLFRSAARKS